MSNLRNRVQLIGHLGTDPEIKSFETGKLAKMRIATNESYKTANGEWKEETTWHNVVAWGPIADRAQQVLQKGAYVLIEGKLTNREYTTDQNEKRYITEVRATNFVTLDKKISNSSDANSTDTVPMPESADDLPF